MDRPQLILDVGGVLLTNLSPFWEELAIHANVPYEQLRSRYKQEMSKALWSGSVTEKEFWIWLCRHFPSIDREHARSLLHKQLKPLPAMERLPDWSERSDIHILSNHRIEWITPALKPIAKYVKSFTVSSEVGYFKPHSAIYAQAQKRLNGRHFVLFVDDQKMNLRQAAQLGWKTLMADEAGKWIEDVTRMLKEQ
ncbi:HAD family hydrolase [Brevibacillus ginsengisoli]|uniref:HAD family hydrolase n=1 Tax=Brevibacillus ginsengisoli TaxID=363854 RepID=UPI003CE9267B